jgi:DNA-binding CsgD family transcriptional regulator/PAS domain-containing protein
MPLRDDLEESLTDTVYRTVFEPDAWADAMRLAALAFPSNGQTFYFLDKSTGRIRPVALEGIAPRWLSEFDTLYFAPDNPWIELSERLHRPGVVRTNERLHAFLRGDEALYRSAYYNEWMRPQDFRYTLGNTLLAEEGVVANVTLLRSPDMSTFDRSEVAAFERLSRHMTRALRMAVRLERTEVSGLAMSALDGLRHGVALVDADLRVVHANRAMEALLRAGIGLRERHGRLFAVSVQAHMQLRAMVAEAISPLNPAAEGQPGLLLRHGSTTLSLQATPARGRAGGYLPRRPLALLSATRREVRDPAAPGVLRQEYGCTPAEARLVVGLLDGLNLRAAAEAAGTTYESARTTLKRVFIKVGVQSQSQLVARLLRDLSARR